MWSLVPVVMAVPCELGIHTDRNQQDGPFHMKPRIGAFPSRQDSA